MKIEVLEEVWREWAGRGQALTTAEWEVPTRLPGWTVRDLFAHMAPGERVVEFFLSAQRVAEPLVTSGAQSLRIFNQPGGLAHTGASDIAERARQSAAASETRVLVGYFTDNAPLIFDELRRVEPRAGAEHPVLGSVSFEALVETAVVEATVHLLDLIAAIGGPPPPERALRETARTLAAVPDPVTFIEAASGRGDAAVLPIMR